MQNSSLLVLEDNVVQTTINPNSNKCVAVVDPFSTGAVVAYNVTKLGYKCIAVYSADLEQLDALTSLIPEGLALAFDAVVGFSSNIGAMVSSIAQNGWEVVAVIAGAETGVEVADLLSEHLKVRTNGTALSECRRNKYLMGETIRSAGIRSVKQVYATKWSDITNFLQTLNLEIFKVIVKPVDSAGSEDVTLCLSWNEVKIAFGNIIGKVNGLGLVNKAVLVQEYLEGTEYVVDCVSRDGEHKVVAIWEYDRRSVNGASFVCYGQRLMQPSEPRFEELIAYQRKVITALGVKHGATHGEVKWCRGEPVLVEVGARCHGLEGFWIPLADRTLGYNQAQVVVDSYVNPEEFAKIPAQVFLHFVSHIVLLLLHFLSQPILILKVDCFSSFLL
jgi:biotin carboxylase